VSQYVATLSQNEASTCLDDFSAVGKITFVTDDDDDSRVSQLPQVIDP